MFMCIDEPKYSYLNRHLVAMSALYGTPNIALVVTRRRRNKTKNKITINASLERLIDSISIYLCQINRKTGGISLYYSRSAEECQVRKK